MTFEPNPVNRFRLNHSLISAKNNAPGHLSCEEHYYNQNSNYFSITTPNAQSNPAMLRWPARLDLKSQIAD